MAVDKLTLTLETKTVGDEAVQKLIENLNKVGTASENAAKKASSSFGGLSAQIKQGFSDPIGLVETQLGKVADKFGSTGLLVGGFATAMVAAGAAAFTLAKATGELAEQQSNQAIRLGVTVKEYGLLSQASKNAGLDGEALVGTMKGLTKALADGSEEGNKGSRALKSLGIESKNAFGNIRPINDLLLDIADRLGDIQNPAEKADKAIAIFGKRGLEVLPIMTRDLRENIQELRNLGVGFDDVAARDAKKLDDALDRIASRFAALKKDLGAGLAIPFIFVFGNDKDKAEAKRQDSARTAQNIATATAYDILNADFMAGGKKAIDPFGFVKSGVPTVTSEDLRAGIKSRAQQATIQGLDPEFRLRERLKEAQRDYNAALEDGKSVEANRAQARIRDLQEELKILERIKGITEGLSTYFVAPGAMDKANPLRPGPRTLFRTSEPGRTGAPNLPEFQISNADIDAANAGRDSAYSDIARAQISGAESRRLSDRDYNLRGLQQAVDYQTRYISLIDNNEVRAINRVTQLRLSGIEQERAAGADNHELDLKYLDVIQQRTLDLLALRKKGQDDYRNAVEGGLQALISGGRSGLSSFFKSQIVGVGSTIAGNVADLTYKSGRLALPGSLVGTADNPSFLGKLLKGTPFGADPAGGIQLSAAQLQLRAASMQIAAASGRAGGGVLATGSTALSGYAGNGIFTNNDSGGGGGNVIYDEMGTPSIVSSSSNSSDSEMSGTQRAMGIAAAGAAGAFGVYSGVKQGGVKGALTATGSLAGASGALLGLAGVSGPAAPILAGVGLALGVITTLFPDPKKQRQEFLSNEAKRRAYTEPASQDYYADISGGSVDYNYRGGTRTYKGAPTIIINAPISAVDAGSFGDFAKRNSVHFADAVVHAVTGGNGEELIGTFRQVM